MAARMMANANAIAAALSGRIKSWCQRLVGWDEIPAFFGLAMLGFHPSLREPMAKNDASALLRAEANTYQARPYTSSKRTISSSPR